MGCGVALEANDAGSKRNSLLFCPFAISVPDFLEDHLSLVIEESDTHILFWLILIPNSDVSYFFFRIEDT